MTTGRSDNKVSDCSKKLVVTSVIFLINPWANGGISVFVFARQLQISKSNMCSFDSGVQFVVLVKIESKGIRYFA